MNLATIPGYREAVAKERFERTAAFAPLLETVCGVQVLPLTFRHLAILETVGSPFVCGGSYSILDVGAFLWIVSPSFVPRGKFLASWKRRRFLKRLGKIRFLFPDPLPEGFNRRVWALKQAGHEIAQYIRDSEQDLPPSQAGRPKPSYCSNEAAVVDKIASEYGWSEAAILDTPLKRLLQYVNRIELRATGKNTAFNRSDEVVQKWLDANQPTRN